MNSLKAFGVTKVASVRDRPVEVSTNYPCTASCHAIYGTYVLLELDPPVTRASLELGATSPVTFDVQGFRAGALVARQEVFIKTPPVCTTITVTVSEIDKILVTTSFERDPFFIGKLRLVGGLPQPPTLYVAMTFDYGPNPMPGKMWDDPTNTTNKVRAILDKYHAKGTFFVEPFNFFSSTAGQDMLAVLANEGHEIGLSSVDPHELHCMYGVSKQLDPTCGPSTFDCLERYFSDAKSALASIPTKSGSPIVPTYVRTPVSENATCGFLQDGVRAGKPPNVIPVGPGRCAPILTPDAGFRWDDLIRALERAGLKLYLRGGTRMFPEYHHRVQYGPSPRTSVIR